MYIHLRNAHNIFIFIFITHPHLEITLLKYPHIIKHFLVLKWQLVKELTKYNFHFKYYVLAYFI